MYKILIVLCLALVGCNHNDDELTGNWELSCYYSQGNVLSQFKGVYSFSGGLFKAEFKSCLNADLDPSLLVVEYPYTTGDYETLGNGIDALRINIHINENDSIPTLIYITENKLCWNWGLDNEALEYSVFGIYLIDGVTVWGGYPLYNNDGVLTPIMDNFIELDKPVTVNFNQYLERI